MASSSSSSPCSIHQFELPANRMCSTTFYKVGCQTVVRLDYAAAAAAADMPSRPVLCKPARVPSPGAAASPLCGALRRGGVVPFCTRDAFNSSIEYALLRGKDRRLLTKLPSGGGHTWRVLLRRDIILFSASVPMSSRVLSTKEDMVSARAVRLGKYDGNIGKTIARGFTLLHGSRDTWLPHASVYVCAPRQQRVEMGTHSHDRRGACAASPGAARATHHPGPAASCHRFHRYLHKHATEKRK